MLGIHLLLAVGLAAFADALSPLGVMAAFVLVYLLLRMSGRVIGLQAYLLRLELGLGFACWFVLEILKASLQVARLVLAPRIAVAPAVVSVPLARRDDRLATLIGVLLTLTPGTLALNYRADQGVMDVHVLDARSEEEVEAALRAIESRLLAWLDAGGAAIGGKR